MAEQGKPEPVDPLSALAAAAVSMHELFTALKAAGFQPYEALWLTAASALGLKPPPGWEEPNG